MSKHYAPSFFVSTVQSGDRYKSEHRHTQKNKFSTSSNDDYKLHVARSRTTELRKLILMNEENAFAFKARRWKIETAGYSSVDKKIRHPAYQDIIRMGMRIVPLILEDLQSGANHWFPALKIITGHSPVSAEDRGDMEKMRRSWLEWGYERNIVVRQ